MDEVTEGVSKLLLQGDVMGRVIGKKGATIKEIREKSGATVDVRSACSLSCCFLLLQYCLVRWRTW